MKRSALLAGTALIAMAAIVTARPLSVRRARRRIAAEPGRPGFAEVAAGVHCLGPRGRTQTNVYLVRTDQACVLVDAGWAKDAGWIRQAMDFLLGPGMSPSAILLTHVHPDHAGAARELAAGWGCPILMHPAEIPIATGDFDAMRRCAGPLDHWLILPLMRAIGRRRREAILEAGRLGDSLRPLPDDGSVPGLDGWRWVPTPGHTPGHVALVRDLDRVVITGDALLTLRVNAVAGLLWGGEGLSAPPWYTTWDGGAARASIRAIAALEPAVLASGHGRPLAGPDTAAAVRRFAAGS